MLLLLDIQTEDQFFWDMTYLRWCVEDNTDYWLYPTDMFKFPYDSDLKDAEAGTLCPGFP